MKIIDTNCSFGNWPIQKFTHRSLSQLDESLDQNQISEAWLTATESILFPDPDVHDFPLFKQIREFPRFKPVKTVNPLFPNWKESCHRAIESHGIVALKAYPNYHGYPSNHIQLQHLAAFAGEQKLPLLVSIRVNDERNQPENLRIAPTNLSAFLTWTYRFPETRFILHAPYMNELSLLKQHPNISADLSFLDQADILQTITQRLAYPVNRLVFGSHACFFYPESSALKLTLSQVAPEIVEQVAYRNIEKLRA